MMKLIYLVAILGFSACSCFSEQGSSLAAWRPSQSKQEWDEEEELDLHRGQELRSDAPDDYIGRLPGQPPASFKQFAGYLPVDGKSGRALFYYFAEAEENPESKPLLLWLNGGPGCSSMIGAMAETGPFGVNPDGKSLYRRHYAWNKAANILFLESPAGVGFSYSNTSSDYSESGDKRTARDSYVFLVKWLQRFPSYMTRDFYIAGESYAGHYIPELAEVILKMNKKVDTNLVVQLKGIMVGNGLMHRPSDIRGNIDFLWSHALISDEDYALAVENCTVHRCDEYPLFDVFLADPYNLYGPICNSSGQPSGASGWGYEYDPCELEYLYKYLNLPQVQVALRANPTRWNVCNFIPHWSSPSTVLPIYRRLMSADLRILLYSGDVDAVVSVTATRYSINVLGLKVLKKWFPWFPKDENEQAAGYRVVYDGLTFATVLGAGHQVPQMQPARAFALLSKFLEDDF